MGDHFKLVQGSSMSIESIDFDLYINTKNNFEIKNCFMIFLALKGMINGKTFFILAHICLHWSWEDTFQVLEYWVLQIFSTTGCIRKRAKRCTRAVILWTQGLLRLTSVFEQSGCFTSLMAFFDRKLITSKNFCGCFFTSHSKLESSNPS